MGAEGKEGRKEGQSEAKIGRSKGERRQRWGKEWGGVKAVITPRVMGRSFYLFTHFLMPPQPTAAQRVCSLRPSTHGPPRCPAGAHLAGSPETRRGLAAAAGEDANPSPTQNQGAAGQTGLQAPSPCPALYPNWEGQPMGAGAKDCTSPGPRRNGVPAASGSAHPHWPWTNEGAPLFHGFFYSNFS